jgi:hypothetical protein
MKPLSFLKLLLPIITFIIFFSVFLFLNENNHREINMGLDYLGISFEIPFSVYFIKKFVLLLLSLASLLSYLFFNFSDLFPSRLKMEVFFDLEGIKKCLCLYSPNELKELSIITNDIEKYQNDYYESINVEAQKILKTPFFNLNNKDIHSEGETTFVVEKFKGIQNYHITESKGELKHIIEREKLDKKEFYTFFEKISSPSDILTPSFKDIFISNKIILKPRFKQIITQKVKEKGKVFNHILCGYTIITFFPFPKYSKTIYLLDKNNVGLIPIGYAVYREI